MSKHLEPIFTKDDTQDQLCNCYVLEFKPQGKTCQVILRSYAWKTLKGKYVLGKNFCTFSEDMRTRSEAFEDLKQHVLKLHQSEIEQLQAKLEKLKLAREALENLKMPERLGSPTQKVIDNKHL